VLAVLLTATGCSGADDASPPAGPSAAATPPPSPSVAAPANYKPLDKACDGVDPTAIKPVLGTEKDRTDDVTTKGAVTAMRCSITYTTALLIAQIDLATPEYTEEMYQGLRKVQESSGSVTEVPGVGQGAYTYTDPATGPHVVAYDGNLHISIAVAPVGGPAPGADVTAKLPQVVQASMQKLRA
jgi:hypothetical protein